MQIAFLSTRWGPQKGGINALNAALCHATSECLTEPILCVVEEATAAERRDAVEQGVFLVVLERPIDSSLACIDAIDQHLALNRSTVNFWVGHDVWTGPTAVALARRSGARSIVLHHMDFEAYAHLKHSDVEAEKRSKRQGDVLRSADMVFGVGPTLTDSATKAQAKVVHQLSPGLPRIGYSATSVGEYEILMIGRLSREDDPIKQVQLAVAAVAKASNARGLGRALWRMRLIGFDPAETDLNYELKLRAIAEGGRAHPNLRLLPFEKVQADLFEKLARSDLVLMPSMREGFGLVGWEAVAAGVPLILGTASGLFRHLTDLGFAPMVHGIDIRGRNASAGEHDNDDVNALADLIESAYRERKENKQRALVLRGALLAHPEAHWHTTADRFLNQVGFAREPRVREFAILRANNLEALSAMRLPRPEEFLFRQRGSLDAVSLLHQCGEAERLFDDGHTVRSFSKVKSILGAIRGAASTHDLIPGDGAIPHAAASALILGTRAASYNPRSPARLLYFLFQEAEFVLAAGLLPRERAPDFLLELASVNQGLRNYDIARELLLALKGAAQEPIFVAKVSSRLLLADLTCGLAKRAETERGGVDQHADRKHRLRSPLVGSWVAMARSDPGGARATIEVAIAELGRAAACGEQQYDPMIELECRLTYKAALARTERIGGATAAANDEAIRSLARSVRLTQFALRPMVHDLFSGMDPGATGSGELGLVWSGLARGAESLELRKVLRARTGELARRVCSDLRLPLVFA